MANPKVSYSISECPGITNKLISVLYSTLAPAAEIDRIVDSSDHSVAVNQAFTDIDPGTYIVVVYQSADGVALGTIQHNFWCDATTNQIIAERIWFEVDGVDADDPIDGAVNYVNAYLDGKPISGIFQEGFRFLEDVVEWQPLAGGGITLLLGRQFASGQKWSIDVAYKTSVAPVASNDIYGNIIIVPGNLIIDASHYNASLYCNCAATTQTISFPFLAGVPLRKTFMVVHDGGNQINTKLLAKPGEVFHFRGTDLNYIYLAKGEYVKIVKTATKWFIFEWNGQWSRIGEQIAAEVMLDNSLLMDGTLYDGTVYLRIYEIVATVIPAGQKSSLAGWFTGDKQRMWAIDTGTKQFRVPNRLGMATRFLYNIGGGDTHRADNVPGGYQPDMVGPHFHAFKIGNGAGAPMADYNPVDGNAEKARENTEVNDAGSTGSGPETTVKNIGALPLIFI